MTFPLKRWEKMATGFLLQFPNQLFFFLFLNIQNVSGCLLHILL